jgi:glucosamine-6-phosphate deaminase
MSDCTLPSLSSCEHLQVDLLKIEVYSSSTELTQNAAKLAQDYLQSLLANQETVSIVLATGNSQLQFLDCLVATAQVDWSRVILYHLDEYLGIAEDNPGSFRYYLKEKVASKISPRQFYFIEGDAIQPLAECSRYSQLLQQKTIDLCLLGIGDNGHLAFNEPSVADFNDPYVIKLVKLEKVTCQQQIKGAFFSNLNDVPNYAYTLTIPTICQAKKIFCLAPGEQKQEVVRKTLNEAITVNFPATILRTQPQAILFCDRFSFPNHLKTNH